MTKILIFLLVKVVQFQGRAEFYVQLLSRDIGKLWKDENEGWGPLEDLSKSLQWAQNGQKQAKS